MSRIVTVLSGQMKARTAEHGLALALAKTRTEIGNVRLRFRHWQEISGCAGLRREALEVVDGGSCFDNVKG